MISTKSIIETVEDDIRVSEDTNYRSADVRYVQAERHHLELMEAIKDLKDAMVDAIVSKQ